MDKEKIEKKLGRNLNEKEEKEFNYYNKKSRVDFEVKNNNITFFETCWCGEKLSSNSSIYCNRHYNNYM
jgi:hypothetical protein